MYCAQIAALWLLKKTHGVFLASHNVSPCLPPAPQVHSPGGLTFLKKNIQQTINSALSSSSTMLEPPLEAEYKTTAFFRSCETNFKIQDRKMMHQKIIINRLEFK